MDEQLFAILKKFRSCFSRKSTYHWFILVIIGLIVRGDHYGVSSIVRWLSLAPGGYWSTIHFFTSTGWTLQGLLSCWWSMCFPDAMCLKVQGRYVMVGDHTNQPKEGRKMPEVITIHQNSETSSKPSYFRGHVFGFIALLMEKAQKCFAVPLQGELNTEGRNKKDAHSMATRIVYNAILIAEKINAPSYLILDAFFATGPVFLAAKGVYSIAARVPWVHIITHAKKNAVAYLDPEPAPPGKRGPKKQYGKKIKLFDLFREKAEEFIDVPCCIYGKIETVKILCLDLLWKPIKGKIRFVLAMSSRGPIVLMCLDLTLPAHQILELYCRRALIEDMFRVLKNLVGGLSYHFWSKLIEKTSRRPRKNKDSSQSASAQIIERKVRSIEMFANLCTILVGTFQILALHFPQEIWKENIHWLRTYSNKIPSEYIVKGLLTQTIFGKLHKVNNHAIYALIRSKQSQPNNIAEFKKVA